MHVTGLLLLAGIVLQSVSAQQSPVNISKVERFFYDRCRHYSTDAVIYDEIKKNFTQLSEYLDYAASLLPNGKQQFCEDEKPKLIAFSRNLAKGCKACMAPEEKYLPAYLYNSFARFLNFACEGRNVENFFSSQGTDCRRNLKEHQAGEELGGCFSKAFVRFNEVVKKDDYCDDLKKAKRCFGEALDRHCADFAAYRSLNDKFFDAVMDPCKPSSGVTFGLNSVILVIAAFISVKII